MAELMEFREVWRGGGGVCNLLTKKLASTESGLPVAHPHAMVIFADSGLVILAV